MCGVIYCRVDRYTTNVCGETCRHMIFVYGREATDKMREEVLRRAESEKFFGEGIPWTPQEEVLRMKKKIKTLLFEVRESMGLEQVRYQRALARKSAKRVKNGG